GLWRRRQGQFQFGRIYGAEVVVVGVEVATTASGHVGGGSSVGYHIRRLSVVVGGMVPDIGSIWWRCQRHRATTVYHTQSAVALWIHSSGDGLVGGDCNAFTDDDHTVVSCVDILQ